MNQLTLREPLRALAAALRYHDIVPANEFETGLVHIEAQAERIALDALTAIRMDIPFSEAASDYVNFPHLARVHSEVDDILTLELPPKLEGWLKSVLAMPEPPSLDMMRTALIAAAADALNPHQWALARFGVFEGVRLNLVLMAKLFPQETLGVGVALNDLDRIAEATISTWLASSDPTPAETRPFTVIVAAAMSSLTKHAEDLRAGIGQIQRDFLEEAQRRATVEQILSEMDVRDALLIRNEIAPDFGEQRLTVELLQERHELVMGGVSRNALDQRITRARKKTREALRRRRVALLDLLRGGR